VFKDNSTLKIGLYAKSGTLYFFVQRMALVAGISWLVLGSLTEKAEASTDVPTQLESSAASVFKNADPFFKQPDSE